MTILGPLVARQASRMSEFNVGDPCRYVWDGSEYSGGLGGPVPGVVRPGVIAMVNGSGPWTYCVTVFPVTDTSVGDTSGVTPSISLSGISYSASLAQGKVSPANFAQVPGGAIAAAINAASSDAASALSTASSVSSQASDLSQVKTQQGSSTGITAGAGATVLISDGDRAVAAGKAVQADATLSIVNSSLLATATVTAKLQKSTDGGSNWTDVVTKTFVLNGAVGNLIPARCDPAFSATCDRATAGNVRTRLTVSSTGANVTVSESGLTTRWGVTPN